MTQEIERIEHDGRLLAIIIPADCRPPGITFLTGNDEPMQLGVLRHPAGKTIEAHSHPEQARTITRTQEVLFVRAGRMRADFYDDDGNFLESRILGAGDTVLLVSGGHGFETLEETDFIEAKTGPYLEDRDKRRFGSEGPAGG